MFELFSDIFACRDNALARMDARPKMVIAFTLIIAVVLSRQPYFPFLMFVLCTAGMLWLKMPAKLVLARLVMPMGIVLVLVVLQAFLTGSTPFVSFSFAGYRFIGTEEGIMQGVLLGSRVLGAVSVMLLLSSVTPAFKIFGAMQWFRVPEGWIEIALLVYRYTFVLLDQTADTAAAQRVRLGYSSPRRALSSAGVLAGTVVVRSMDQAMRTHEAMTLRGYQGRLPVGVLPKLKTADYFSMLAVPTLTAALYVIAEWWPK
ncbi:MAG: cobalt ECF transporter T component CbiQ [Desulfomonilaceae bacterium]